MKLSIIFLLFLILSCDKKQENTSVKEINQEIIVKNEKLSADDIDLSNPWFQFYQKENPNFKQELFELHQTSPITYHKSSILPLNEKGFDKVYYPFLIFDESKNLYIDFDSSNWICDDAEHVYFEVDQQVVLVDLKKKKSNQIGFFGSSSWIEDGYWKGDSVAVLLGNGYDKKPFILKYNFKKNMLKNYKYLDTINSKTSYSIFRMKSKGLKFH